MSSTAEDHKSKLGMPDDRLGSLHDAVNALNSPDSLLLLNIDEDLLEDPATTLEYVARCRAWIQLRNIAKSIPDLLGQYDRVALVGFLGHFSSGKSSLINALLEVADNQNPGYKRDVGVHPTDTGITLITHRDHAQVIRKSAYTAIDAVEVVHGPALDFLEHATLVDTPGLGNEAAEHETVARFLHLCHVLVITIDGRRPFADKDKDFELLNTAFNKLGGVPKLLVVTSAEEFLTSRKADFETGWLPEQADAFWVEAVERLGRDSRFQDHLHRFATAPRFFVDSKEGFNIDAVKDALLPIVTDDAQRARIRQAQSEYVLSTAADALQVLLAYISTRSENLNRLLREAQQRADGTATAVEELLESLESSFQAIMKRIEEARQATPSGNFSIEAIVTQQSVNESQGAILGNLEGEIVASLEEQMRKLQEPAWRRTRRYFRAKTRGWFQTKKALDVAVLSERRFDLTEHRRELSTASISCARVMLQAVNQQLAGAFAGALQHLRNRSEAWEIGSSEHDIELALGKFQRVHDDSIRSFYAYIAAPSSSDLLREHGFVGFDETGNQAIQTDSINAMGSAGFVAISQASESCKQRLRALGSEEPEDLTRTLDDEEARSIEDTAFGERYCDDVENHVNEACNQKVGAFVDGLVERVDRFVDRVEEERLVLEGALRRIWKARAILAGRAGLVGLVLALCIIGISEFAPNKADALVSMLSGNLLETVITGAVSTILVLALVFIATGAKNEIVKTALVPILYKRFKFLSKCRSLETALAEYFNESYDFMIDGVKKTPLEIDGAIAKGIKKGLEQDSASYQKAEEALREVWKVIDGRAKLFDEYIDVVGQRMEGIPKELKEKADEIKNDTIERHMGRIRDAASAVEKVRGEVQRTAEIAVLSS